MMSSSGNFSHVKGNPNRKRVDSDLLQQCAGFDKWALVLGVEFRAVPISTISRRRPMSFGQFGEAQMESRFQNLCNKKPGNHLDLVKRNGDWSFTFTQPNFGLLPSRCRVFLTSVSFTLKD